MPQHPVRISWGSILREQGSRDNADMDLSVAETQERGNQTPTLSGEAIKEGENIIRSEILSWHQHETKNALASGFWRYYRITRLGCHSKNQNTTSTSLWAEDERTVDHKNLGLDATPT